MNWNQNWFFCETLNSTCNLNMNEYIIFRDGIISYTYVHISILPALKMIIQSLGVNRFFKIRVTNPGALCTPYYDL